MPGATSRAAPGITASSTACLRCFRSPRRRRRAPSTGSTAKIPRQRKRSPRYRAYFVDDINISNPEDTVAVCAGLGYKPEEVRAAINDAQIKELVKAEVDKAIACGAFGSPYIVVNGEAFWGADRLVLEILGAHFETRESGWERKRPTPSSAPRAP